MLAWKDQNYSHRAKSFNYDILLKEWDFKMEDRPASHAEVSAISLYINLSSLL